MSDLAKQNNIAKSMISIFLKNKETIKAADAAEGVATVNSNQRPQGTDDVEKLLLSWIK